MEKNFPYKERLQLWKEKNTLLITLCIIILLDMQYFPPALLC